MNSGKEKATFLVLAITMALISNTLNYKVSSPIVHNDELGYLTNAAAIAGYRMDMANDYFAGYSIVISPAFTIGQEPFSIWFVIKIINTILFFCTIFLMWIICKELIPEIGKRDRVIVVVMSSLYPTWIVMVGYSFSHNAFIPFYLLTVWLLIRSLKSGRFYWFILLGVVSGYLYWIHPSGALVIVSLFIVAIYFSYTKKAYFIEFFAFTAIALFMICLYRMSFEPWLKSMTVLENSDLVYNYPSESEFILGTLKNLGSVEFYWRVLSHIGSRVLYLTVSSVGIICFGVYASWKKWSNKNAEDRVVYLFLLLSFVLILLFSVKVHAGAGNRIDYWLHGRYIEQVLPPILILGFYEFIRNNFNVKSLFIVILATLLSALLVSVNVKSFDLNVPYIQMASFWPVYFIENQEGIWIWTAVGLIPLVLINVIPASTRRTLGALIVAIIFVSTGLAHVNYHIEESRDVVISWSSAIKLRESFPDKPCVAFNASDFQTKNGFNYYFDLGFILYEYKVRRMSFEEWYNSSDCVFYTFDRNLIVRGFKVYPVAATPLRTLIWLNGIEQKIWYPLGPWVWVKGDPRNVIRYPASVSDRSPTILMALGEGWYYFEGDHVWSGRQATLKILIPEECYSGDCKALLKVKPYGAAESRPAKIYLKDCESEAVYANITTKSSSSILISVLIKVDKNELFQCVEITAPNATSPFILEGVKDVRELGVALYSLDIKQKNERIF